jgi:hypothetical protein
MVELLCKALPNSGNLSAATPTSGMISNSKVLSSTNLKKRGSHGQRFADRDHPYSLALGK